MTLLLVEDEEMLRAGLAEQLEAAGIEVVAVPNGGAAMAQLRRRELRFEALVCDLHLGDGVGGLPVAEEMERRFPRARIVVITGRFDLLDLRWHERGWILMAKPFAGERLLAALRAERED